MSAPTSAELCGAAPVRDVPPVGWHPAVDEFDERYVVFATPSPTVRFTEPFASFIAEAGRRDVPPVLVTTTTASVSPFVSSAMRRAGGTWGLQARDGTVYDALSGYQVGSLGDLGSLRRKTSPEGTESDEACRLPGFYDPPVVAQQVVQFDVRTTQRAVEGAQVGTVAESLGNTMGASWQCWATREPLLEPWDLRVVTETMRRAMPDPSPLRVTSTEGAFCEVRVARTGVGLAEHTVGGIPADDSADVLGLANAAAEQLVAEHNPTLAFVSVADYDRTSAGVVHPPRARTPESPLVVLCGAAAVRDLDLDIDRVVAEHDARVLGRARLPCVLVQFAGTDPAQRWAQAAGFTSGLGRRDTPARLRRHG
ncbi:MAG: DUF6177 family protein [Micrococcales bacterium]|nr:DUF6177 family protein [Micrococcales bacterium]